MHSDFCTAFQVTKLAATGIASIFGFCLCFLAVPNDEVLRNYRTGRKLLGIAYCIFAAINIFGYFLRYYYPHISHSYVNAHLTMIVASYQTLFLPLAIVTLINSDYLDQKKHKPSLILISMLSLFSTVSFFMTFPDWFTKAVFLIFLSNYFFRLVTSTRLIITETRSARKRIDDYFSSREPLHIGWVMIMGLLSNSCGVFALLVILVQSWTVAFLVLLYSTVVYAILSVKYLNYIYVFNLVVPVIHPGEVKAKYQKSRLEGFDVDRLLLRLDTIMRSKKTVSRHRLVDSAIESRSQLESTAAFGAPERQAQYEL